MSDDKSAKRLKVIAEIIETERIYSDSISKLVAEYIQPLKQHANEWNIKHDKISAIFSNLETISGFHTILYNEFQQHSDSTSSIAKTILRFADFLRLYTTYVNNYSHALKSLTELQHSSKKFIQFQQDRRAVMSMDLASYLIMPVQRIPRYELLLKELKRNLDPSAEEEAILLDDALAKVVAVAQHVNEMKREAERASELLAVQSKIIGLEQHFKPLFATHRRIVKEGEVYKKSTFGRSSRTIYLFNDLFIWTEKNKYKGHINVSTAKVKELTHDSDNEYGFEFQHPQSKTQNFYAEHVTERNSWMSAFQEAIAEARELEINNNGSTLGNLSTPSTEPHLTIHRRGSTNSQTHNFELQSPVSRSRGNSVSELSEFAPKFSGEVHSPMPRDDHTEETKQIQQIQEESDDITIQRIHNGHNETKHFLDESLEMPKEHPEKSPAKEITDNKSDALPIVPEHTTETVHTAHKPDKSPYNSKPHSRNPSSHIPPAAIENEHPATSKPSSKAPSRTHSRKGSATNNSSNNTTEIHSTENNHHSTVTATTASATTANTADSAKSSTHGHSKNSSHSEFLAPPTTATESATHHVANTVTDHSTVNTSTHAAKPPLAEKPASRKSSSGTPVADTLVVESAKLSTRSSPATSKPSSKTPSRTHSRKSSQNIQENNNINNNNTHNTTTTATSSHPPATTSTTTAATPAPITTAATTATNTAATATPTTSAAKSTPTKLPTVTSQNTAATPSTPSTANLATPVKSNVIPANHSHKLSSNSVSNNSTVTDFESDLKQAADALAQMSRNDMLSLKKMKSPPLPVKLAIESVAVLMDIEPSPPDRGSKLPNYWIPVQGLLVKPNFLRILLDFNEKQSNLSEATTARLSKYINDPQLLPSLVSVCSSSAGILWKWVRAYYAKITQVPLPKDEFASIKPNTTNNTPNTTGAKSKVAAVIKANPPATSSSSTPKVTKTLSRPGSRRGSISGDPAKVLALEQAKHENNNNGSQTARPVTGGHTRTKSHSTITSPLPTNLGPALTSRMVRPITNTVNTTTATTATPTKPTLHRMQSTGKLTSPTNASAKKTTLAPTTTSTSGTTSASKAPKVISSSASVASLSTTRPTSAAVAKKPLLSPRPIAGSSSTSTASKTPAKSTTSNSANSTTKSTSSASASKVAKSSVHQG